MKTNYIQGETLAYSIADGSYAAVVFRYGSVSVGMTLDSGTWSCTVATAALAGRYRFAVIADGVAIDTGSFVVQPLESKYRSVVAAIDDALQANAANGKYSIQVGEIHLQDKTFDEMVKARNYYMRLANAEENGETPSFGPRRVSEVYS